MNDRLHAAPSFPRGYDTKGFTLDENTDYI
jgi:hypothetical protein